MTQPIQEPGSTTRTDARLTWGSNQLFRRPSPASADPTISAYLADLISNGTGASVANDTWVDAVTGVDLANSRWFDEFNLFPAEWSVNFTTGSILSAASDAYNYAAWGYVVFDVADGTTCGAAISWVGAEIQANTAEVVDGVTRVEVSAERTPIPAGGVRLRCYQASGGAADIIEARLHVRRFELYEGVYEQEFAT